MPNPDYISISIDDNEDDLDSISRQEESLYLNIRFTADFADVLGHKIDAKLTVGALKQKLVSLIPELVTRKLRIIYLGRLLTDGIILAPYLDTLLGKQAKQKEDNTSFLATVASNVVETLNAPSKDIKGKGKAKEEDTRPGKSIAYAVWLNCSVGQPGSIEDEVKETTEEATTQPLSGFDRLQEAGFSVDEIANMRDQFRRRHENNVELGPVADDQDEHIRALESAWLEGMGNQELATTDPFSSGEYTTLFKGVCVGFFFPIIPFFLFSSSIFNKRTQIGIVAGTVVNLLFGLLRYIS